MVYNVTPYMDYHPGGEEELMKAAGIDGTDLFDQVWKRLPFPVSLKVLFSITFLAISGYYGHHALPLLFHRDIGWILRY